MLSAALKNTAPVPVSTRRATDGGRSIHCFRPLQDDGSERSGRTEPAVSSPPMHEDSLTRTLSANRTGPRHSVGNERFNEQFMVQAAAQWQSRSPLGSLARYHEHVLRLVPSTWLKAVMNLANRARDLSDIRATSPTHEQHPLHLIAVLQAILQLPDRETIVKEADYAKCNAFAARPHRDKAILECFATTIALAKSLATYREILLDMRLTTGAGNPVLYPHGIATALMRASQDLQKHIDETLHRQLALRLNVPVGAFKGNHDVSGLILAASPVID